MLCNSTVSALLCSHLPLLFAVGVYDTGKTQLLTIIHTSIFIRVSVGLSGLPLLKGKQVSCCCSLQLLASRRLFWKRSVWVLAGLWGQVRERKKKESRNSLTQFILTLTLWWGLNWEPDRLINIPQGQNTHPVIPCYGSGESKPRWVDSLRPTQLIISRRSSECHLGSG